MMHSSCPKDLAQNAPSTDWATHFKNHKAATDISVAAASQSIWLSVQPDILQGHA
jgi:hypothetical protein